MRKFPDNVIWWLSNPIDFLRRINGKIYRRFHPHEPWISLDAVKYCELNLKKSFKALEWGSGRSTVWFANRVGKLTSVEDNKKWFEIVSNRLNELKLTHVDYRFIELDHPINEPAKPIYQVQPRYVAVINEFDDNSLDFVVVDGHYRQACINAVIPKLKSGGLLLVDNSNWMPKDNWGVPKAWPICHSSHGFDGETTIWQKP